MNYQASEKLSLYTTFSNFKTAQNTYYRAPNSVEVDSLILSQVNQNIALGSNYIVGKERPMTISLLYSFQSSNSIQDDQVSSNQLDNNLLNLTCTKSFGKHQLSLNSNFTITKAENLRSTAFLTSLNHSVELGDKITWQNTLGYNTIKFDARTVNQISISQTLQYQIKENVALNLDANIELADTDDQFKLNSMQFNVGLAMNIKPKTIIK